MKKEVLASIIVVCIAVFGFVNMEAENIEIDRYETDFRYHNIGYKILSESAHTVAVTQDFDIDFYGNSEAADTPPKSAVGDNGFLMSNGFFGPFVVIPDTVYDSHGTPYTVVALANEAINYVWTGTLVLPSSLKHLNGGIFYMPTVSTVLLPSGLEEIKGISHCENLKTLYIPENVNTICDYSLSHCGFAQIYLPPSVKTLGNEVLSYCDSLTSVMLSAVQVLGSECFKDCGALTWANIPETMKSMGDGCFNNCKSLDRISLPWSEIKMNDCFNGCSSVKCIEVLAKKPYTFPENCFKDVDKHCCDLIVPEESVDLYMTAEGWKDFYRINGLLTSSVDVQAPSSQNPNIVATVGKGYIMINNVSGLNVDILNLNGEKVTTVVKAGVSKINLESGVYIVSAPSFSTKVRII